MMIPRRFILVDTEYDTSAPLPAEVERYFARYRNWYRDAQQPPWDEVPDCIHLDSRFCAVSTVDGHIAPANYYAHPAPTYAGTDPRYVTLSILWPEVKRLAVAYCVRAWALSEVGYIKIVFTDAQIMCDLCCYINVDRVEVGFKGVHYDDRIEVTTDPIARLTALLPKDRVIAKRLRDRREEATKAALIALLQREQIPVVETAWDNVAALLAMVAKIDAEARELAAALNLAPNDSLTETFAALREPLLLQPGGPGEKALAAQFADLK